jgi:hypothetical protein
MISKEAVKNHSKSRSGKVLPDKIPERVVSVPLDL